MSQFSLRHLRRLLIAAVTISIGGLVGCASDRGRGYGPDGYGDAVTAGWEPGWWDGGYYRERWHGDEHDRGRGHGWASHDDRGAREARHVERPSRATGGHEAGGHEGGAHEGGGHEGGGHASGEGGGGHGGDGGGHR